MRYLVKGDSGVTCPDAREEGRLSHRRFRRRLFYRFVAILCALLAGMFAWQLFSPASRHSVSVSATEWDSPASVFSMFKSCVLGVGWQVRSGLQDALPFGNLAIILKMAFCAVAAAVFLRGPRNV